MKRIVAVIIGSVAVGALFFWSRHADAQMDHGEVEFDEMTALWIDEAPELDEQFRGPGRRGPGGMGMAPELPEGLELTEQQQERLKSLRTAFAKDMARLRADLEVAQIELREVLEATNPQASQATAKAVEVSAARAKVFERTVAFQVAAKSVLTPEQQKALQNARPRMMQNRRPGMMRGPRRQMFERRMGPPGQRAPQPETAPETQPEI